MNRRAIVVNFDSHVDVGPFRPKETYRYTIRAAVFSSGCNNGSPLDCHKESVYDIEVEIVKWRESRFSDLILGDRGVYFGANGI